MIRLKKELFKQHISQAECARRSGCNQTSISRILQGKEPPYPNRAKRIADAMGWRGDPMKLFEEVQDDEPIAR